MTNKNSNLDSHNKRNSLGINKQVYKHLLNKLESSNQTDSKQPTQRVFTRLQYLDPYFEITLDQAESTSRRNIIVASRNISRGGMSVLHSNYLYPGTTISGHLRKCDGSLHPIEGSICRCNHRGGVVHEVGIRFDHEITIQEFVISDINDSLRSLEAVDPTELKGKVLFVGADQSITPFLREYLSPTNLNFGFDESAQAAMDKNLDQYDLIFVSLDAGNLSGPEFIRCARDSGFNKPIILCGRTSCNQTRKQIRLSTADMFLPAPFTENSLLCALGEYLITSWSENKLELVRNNVELDSVDNLHNELIELANTLDSQFSSQDPVEAYITCTKIRNIATILGMKSLHNLTFTVCEEIAQTGDIEKFQAEFSSIDLICKGIKTAA